MNRKHLTCSKKTVFSSSLVLVCVFLFLLSAPRIIAEEAESLSIDDDMVIAPEKKEPYIKEKIENWTLKCITPEGSTERCEANQIIINNRQQPVAEISIFKLPEGQVAAAAATILVPLETVLPEGLILAIQDIEPKKYPFKFCNSLGCYSQIGLTEKEVEALKNKEKASILLKHISSGDQQIVIPISLVGFTKAFSKIIRP